MLPHAHFLSWLFAYRLTQTLYSATMKTSSPNRIFHAQPAADFPQAGTGISKLTQGRSFLKTPPVKTFCFAGHVGRWVILAFAAILAVTLRAQTPIISDIGSSAPTPGPDDQYQLTTGGGSPDGLNYYFDNSTPPGQTFTTGSNPGGYTLNTLAIGTAGNSGGSLPAGGQAYTLYIYQVLNGTNATLIKTYVSQSSFSFTDDDWLQWTNLGAPLLPNTQYAYTLHRNSSGWENLANVSGNPYPGGEVCLIPAGGGTITFGSSHSYDAAFDVGLLEVTALQATTPAFSPSGSVTNGTQVTASSTVVGPGPYSYQWLTDGGSGGVLTNIPAANAATLSINTASLATGFYNYALVVSNSTTSVTSAPAMLVVNPALTPTVANLVDAGLNISSGVYDISQLTGNSGGNYDGLNYYDDNGANHDGWMGQTFTTGTNAQGYYLTSVALQTGGGGYSSTSTNQPYHLYVFLVDSNYAATIAHYTNASFSFTFGDWLEWSGFSLVLKPNTTYAYGFGRDSSGIGWAGLNSSATNADLYPGGQICSIPAEGGSITYGLTGREDAVFDVGLLAIGVGPSPLPFAQPITVSPGPAIAAGTTLTLTESTTNGTPPLHYQWLTDGGAGTLTNIPASDSTNLVVSTTGWKPGVYQYEVIVHNTYGSSTSAVSSVTVLFANTVAVMSDVGATLPTPLPGDISQLIQPSGANSPDGLNYYFDNATPPGQTFTTGSNPNGYLLTSAAIDLAGNSGSLPANGQTYTLRIYTVSNSLATLYAMFTSQTTTFVATDWLRWSGFAVPLAPNTVYGYSLARTSTGSGWDNLANVSGNPYSGGEVVLIPVNGGSVFSGSSHSYDATFNLGLALGGYPAVGPALFSPTNSVFAGTPVTATAFASGTGTLTYQWQTDGGSGGALTNIPGATSPTLAINTTGMDGLNVAYDLVVTSGGNATTNEISVLAVVPGTAPLIQNDISPAAVSAFPGASVAFTASFIGTLPLTYQWQVDKGTGPTNIAGQNSATLTLNNLQLSDAGTYYLVASNSLGNASSSGGVLTMYPNPTNPFTCNFQWISTQGNNNVGAYTGPGIPGYGTGTYWNPINGPSANNGYATYTSSSGYDDTGSADIGVSMTVSTPESWDWTSSPVIALLDSAVTARADTLPFSFSLPDGRYNIVIFSCNGTESLTADAGAQITVAGVTETALPTQDTNFVQGDNYVVFSGVVVTNASLNCTITPVAGKSYGSLNGAQVQYVGPYVVMQLTPVAGGQFQLQWSQGTLLEATNLLGPWTTNAAASPFTITPSGPQKFYRVRVK